MIRLNAPCVTVLFSLLLSVSPGQAQTQAQSRQSKRNQSTDQLIKHTRALTLARKARDRRAEATALNKLGFWYIDRTGFEKALEYGLQARQLSLSIGDRENEAEALLLLGTASYHKRDIASAKDYLNSCLAMFSAAGDKNGETRVREMMGHINLDVGNTAEALRLFKQSHALAEQVNDSKQIGETLNGIAITFSIIGEKQEAVEYYRRALEIFEKIGDRRQEAITLNGLGFIYYTVGQNERSLHYYSRALAMFRRVGDRDGEGIALMRIGNNSEAIWGKKTAAAYYEKLRVFGRQIKDPIFESHALNWLGDVVADSNRREALAYYEQALALIRRYKNPRMEAYTLNRLGLSHATLRKTETARNYYNEALHVAQTIGDRESERLTLYHLAALEHSLNELAAAQSYIERSLKLTESLSTAVGDRDLRASYFAGVHAHYEFYIELLMALHQQDSSAGFAAKALEASERSRARSLLEMLGEGRADITKGVNPQLLEQERLAREKLQTAIQNQLRLSTEKHSRQEADFAKQEVFTLTIEHEQILGAIRQESPQYAALTQPVTLTASQMQQLLDDDTLMVEYSMGERKSFAWAVTKESVDGFELPQRSTIEELVRTVYEEISTNPDDASAKNGIDESEKYARAMEKLSAILLKPLTKYPDKKRLVIVADGALHYIPFSVLQKALPATGTLLHQYEIVNLPSASALAVQRQTLGERPSATRSVAVIADPVFKLDDSRFNDSKLTSSTRGPKARKPAADADVSNVARVLRSIGAGRIERLPFSGREANAVFELISTPDAGMKAVGFRANRDTVLSGDLGDYRIIHFATHGFVDNQHPQLSGLVLSMFDEHGRKQNGFLTLNDIYNLKLSADLVVLSACQTGLGKLIRGEGIVGLTRGFMYAGAPRVVASLWRVDDAATAELMRAFYRGMLVDQLAPADALRAAQRELSKQRRYEHPYYWAGFVIQGEWK